MTRLHQPDFAPLGKPVSVRIQGQDPTSTDLADPLFEAIWQAIKAWDIQRRHGEGRARATGTDVMTVLRAVRAVPAPTPASVDRFELALVEAWFQAREAVLTASGNDARPDEMAPLQEDLDVAGANLAHAWRMSRNAQPIKAAVFTPAVLDTARQCAEIAIAVSLGCVCDWDDGHTYLCHGYWQGAKEAANKIRHEFAIDAAAPRPPEPQGQAPLLERLASAYWGSPIDRVELGTLGVERWERVCASVRADHETECAGLREQLAAAHEISGSFFEALKPLALESINVGNPGAHVTDLIRERDTAHASGFAQGVEAASEVLRKGGFIGSVGELAIRSLLPPSAPAPEATARFDALTYLCFFCGVDCRRLSANCCPSCVKKFSELQPVDPIPPPEAWTEPGAPGQGGTMGEMADWHLKYGFPKKPMDRFELAAQLYRDWEGFGDDRFVAAKATLFRNHPDISFSLQWLRVADEAARLLCPATPKAAPVALPPTCPKCGSHLLACGGRGCAWYAPELDGKPDDPPPAPPASVLPQHPCPVHGDVEMIRVGESDDGWDMFHCEKCAPPAEVPVQPRQGCDDLDSQWPGQNGQPRGPVLCVSYPDCLCGEKDGKRPAQPATSPLHCPNCGKLAPFGHYVPTSPSGLGTWLCEKPAPPAEGVSP